MLTKIIEVERDYSVTDLCEVCFTTSQKSNLYKISLGFENNGTINKKGKTICTCCLKELRRKLEVVF